MRPSVLFLQETKLGPDRENEIESWASSVNMQYCMVPAVGSAGGRVSMWMVNALLVKQTQRDQHFIALFARTPSSDNCVEVKHIFREGNVVVDILANFDQNSTVGVWKLLGSKTTVMVFS